MFVRSKAPAIALALATLAAAPAGAQTAGRIVRESVTPTGAESQGQAAESAVSADGRFVAFQSDAADLVPGDTNGDTDVFVRDRSTGVLQRVSLTWNGGEAKGDSTSPSLSKDGRYVAFTSRASNMSPGPTTPPNLEMIYVHDRQERTTVRVSNAVGGGLPNSGSDRPAISGDGQRIVFQSFATNLVSNDANRVTDVFLHDRVSGATTLVSAAGDGGAADAGSQNAAISQDGSVVAFESEALNLLPPNVPLPPNLRRRVPHVYSRDLSADANELVSVAFDSPAGGAQGFSRHPSISADGSRVAYVSRDSRAYATTNLTLDRIFVRDRVAGTSWDASPINPRETDCGRAGDPFSCRSGSLNGAMGPPAISADGRFVTFASRSLLHLPVNPSHGDQIYLFDNLSRRLRRLSVDATGVPGDACSWEPAISGDGRTVAYASKSDNLLPGGAPPDPDVRRNVEAYAQDWACDDAGTCRRLASCPATPAECTDATSSLLRLRKHPPGGVNPDELYWRWYGAPSADPFPDPLAGATYQACIYASDAVVLDAAAADAPACAGSDRPCWKKFGTGYKLLDPAGGLTDVTVSNGERVRRIQVRGKGPLLEAPYLPVDGSRGIVVQLHETRSGQCWGTDFPASSIERNVAGTPGSGSRRDGWLVAENR